MNKNPGEAEKQIKDAIKAARSMDAKKKVLNLTPAKLEAELKQYLDTREVVSDLEAKLITARNNRDAQDVEGLALVNRIVNAIKPDEGGGQSIARDDGLHHQEQAPERPASHHTGVGHDSHSQGRMSGPGLCQIPQAGRAGLVRPFLLFSARQGTAAARARRGRNVQPEGRGTPSILVHWSLKSTKT